ncbi:MAG TPA: class I SAM-dependent methyltransferase [Thermoanaerobaculia bacterium]
MRKFFRLPLQIYYRLLLGRRVPGGARLARWARALEARSGRGDLPLPRGAWEEQYRAGTWDYLEEPGELARYGVVAAAVRRLRPGGTVLDVGCGEGLLAEHLGPDGCRRYLGIDLSAAAVSAAMRRTGPGARPTARFAVADADDWPLRGTFDAVVLNECLYYLREPLEAARRALAALRPGGILVVSMFRTARTRGLARLLARELPLVEEVVLSSRRGAWIVGFYRAAERGA